MLGTSASHNDQSIDLLGVGDESVDVGLTGGRSLSAITEAAVLRDEHEIATAREQAVGELGGPATMRAIAVAANFEMMNRLLDAVGIGPSPPMRSIGERIGVPLPPRFMEP
jgi:hypothetical protein